MIIESAAINKFMKIKTDLLEPELMGVRNSLWFTVAYNSATYEMIDSILHGINDGKYTAFVEKLFEAGWESLSMSGEGI